MQLLNDIGNFLLSEWLWNMTFAWSYLLFAVCVTCLFLRCVMSLSLFRSMMLSLLVNGFSFVLYSAIVVGVFIHGLQWWYVPQEYEVPAGPLLATYYLALIYGLLHCLLFYLVHRYYGYAWWRLCAIAIISNSFAALLSAGYIGFMFKHLL